MELDDILSPNLIVAVVVGIVTFFIESIVEDTVFGVMFSIIYDMADSVQQSGLSTASACALLIRLIPPVFNAAVTYAGLSFLNRD